MTGVPCLACSNKMLCAIADALATDNIDQALELGLLDSFPEIVNGVCRECDARTRIIIDAREARLHALAARERYRTREARLTERAESRGRKRASVTPQTSVAAPSLPPAAAAALARAKARVAAKQRAE